jgi:hypothetical protein
MMMRDTIGNDACKFKDSPGFQVIGFQVLVPHLVAPEYFVAPRASERELELNIVRARSNLLL